MHVKETRVEVEKGEWRGVVALVESVPGGADWAVVGVEVSALDGSALSAGKLRAAPWGGLLDQARAKVEATSTQSPLLSPSDVYLAAFTVDRRGKSARTERDYAGLAFAYLNFGQERGHKAASHWAAKYGSRSPQRWRMDIKRARGTYLEADSDGILGLTDEACLLLFGEDFFEVLQVENDVEGAESAIWRLESLGDGSTESSELMGRLGRVARRHGTTVEAVRDALLRRERRKLLDWQSTAPPR